MLTTKLRKLTPYLLAGALAVSCEITQPPTKPEQAADENHDYTPQFPANPLIEAWIYNHDGHLVDNADVKLYTSFTEPCPEEKEYFPWDLSKAGKAEGGIVTFELFLQERSKLCMKACASKKYFNRDGVYEESPEFCEVQETEKGIAHYYFNIDIGGVPTD